MICNGTKLWKLVINLSPGYSISESLEMERASYQVNDNIVRFKGEIKKELETTNNLMFILPVDVRPTCTLNFLINAGEALNTNGQSYVRITKLGEVFLFVSGVVNIGNTRRYIRLNSIIYPLK